MCLGSGFPNSGVEIQSLCSWRSSIIQHLSRYWSLPYCHISYISPGVDVRVGVCACVCVWKRENPGVLDSPGWTRAPLALTVSMNLYIVGLFLKNLHGCKESFLPEQKAIDCPSPVAQAVITPKYQLGLRNINRF